jgi:peptidyl-prolyl cis-trans isomerase D
MPARVMTEVFRTAKDGFASADGEKATDRIIFRVTDIKVPTYDAASATVQSIRDQLKNSYNDELMTQYVTRLEADLGTSINQSALAQATGRAPQ